MNSSVCRQPLRFVTFLAPNVRPVYECVARYVGARLGCGAELVDGNCYKKIAHADVAFLCGLPYIQLNSSFQDGVELLAAPVLQGPRYAGRPVYFSDVIVHRDSPYYSFADLRGATWSYNEPNSHSGYGIVRYHLARLGEKRGYFGRVLQAGWHERSIRLVAARKVDASAIDSQVLAVALREHPHLARRLRVIDTLGPSTIQPVVAARRLPARLRADLRSLLLRIHKNRAARAQLSHGFVERFVSVTDRDYDDIRLMHRAAASCRLTARSCRAKI
jgi:phosphonate transport system substrate-binding protein